MARNTRRQSASAQTAISLARFGAPIAVVPALACATRRGLMTLDTLPGVSPARSSRTAVRIVGSRVDSTISDLILTPLLLGPLEPVPLEQCLTFIAEEVRYERCAKQIGR